MARMRANLHHTTQLSMRIRTDLHTRLADLAYDEGRHMRWIVEKALEKYLESASQPDPQQKTA